MSDRVPPHHTGEEVFQIASKWAQKTGWPTFAEDQAIAGKVYEQWIKATDAEFAATHSRNVDVLGDMLRQALAGTHDEEASRYLQVLLLPYLMLRGRREGKLKRQRIH